MPDSLFEGSNLRDEMEMIEDSMEMFDSERVEVLKDLLHRERSKHEETLKELAAARAQLYLLKLQARR